MVRRAEELVQQVLEQEEATVAATPPEQLKKLDPLLGRPSAALDAAAFWVAMGRAEPQYHERLVRTEWERRRAEASQAELRIALRRIEGRVSAGSNLVGGRGRVALHKSWGELNTEEQEAAEVLGWWKQAWADAAAPTVRGTRTDGEVATFADLRPEQKHAAQVLGLSARTWELLATADAAQDRRIREGAAAAEAAAQMSESESEEGLAASSDDDGSADAGGDQGPALSVISEEEDADASQYSVREKHIAEGMYQVDGGDDALSAQRTALERAAEQLQAELRERRASNLALQEEASRAVADPPWRGHSARAGWRIVRQRHQRDRPQHFNAVSHESSRRREIAATEERQHSGTSETRLDADALPLTPRSQASEELKASTPRERRSRAFKHQRQNQQQPQQYGVGQTHYQNAVAWLNKRATRVSAAGVHPPSGVSSTFDACQIGAAQPSETVRHNHQRAHTLRCCDDERVWVRSAVASLALE